MRDLSREYGNRQVLQHQLDLGLKAIPLLPHSLSRKTLDVEFGRTLALHVVATEHAKHVVLGIGQRVLGDPKETIRRWRRWTPTLLLRVHVIQAAHDSSK